MARQTLDAADASRLAYHEAMFRAFGLPAAEARRRGFLLYSYEVAESLLHRQGTAAERQARAAYVERLIQVRGEYLPVICLHEIFRIQGAITDWQKGIMVVLEADGQSAALFIDQLVGQHQVVIKSLEANYRKVSGISGATILGDGHVGLILDVPALVESARGSFAAAA